VNPGYAPRWKSEHIVLDIPQDPDMKRQFLGRVKLNMYPKLQTLLATGVTTPNGSAVLHTAKLSQSNLALIDYDKLYFDIEEYKRVKKMNGLLIYPEKLKEIIAIDYWYELSVPVEMMVPASYANVRVWQEIVTSLLKSYVHAYYYSKQQKWSFDHMEYTNLKPNDPNILQEYEIEVDETDALFIEKVKQLRDSVQAAISTKKTLGSADVRFPDPSILEPFLSTEHLYNPLFYIPDGISLVHVDLGSLNEGEKSLVKELSNYVLREREGVLKGKQIFLLRNRSRAGIGFFEADNFYPDFILWLIEGDKQFIVFIDPKGLVQLNIITNSKIEFAHRIKNLETKLGEEKISLNSYIVSVTKKSTVLSQTGLSEGELNKKNVYFKEDANYIDQIIESVLATKKI
jgi:hypothetical protein